jgi:hypothetical protein
MSDPLDNVNEILEELQTAAIQTSQGSVVRVEHVKKLLEKRVEAKVKETEKRMAEPPPTTLVQARRLAARDLKEAFPSTGPKEPGRSVDAGL